MQKDWASEEMIEFRELFRLRSLRITPQRIAVYRELVRSPDHPSADTLYRAVRKHHPHISYDTVNRTLHTFVSLGLADIAEGMGGVRRYDGDLRPHHHFLCRRCGRIFDFQSPDLDDTPIPAELRNRFDVTSRRVVLSGICRECRNRTQKGPRQNKSS